MDLLKVELGSYNETCHDENEFIDIKVEVTDAQEEEEDPLLIKFPLIKSELEVSCMMVCTRVVQGHCGLCVFTQNMHVTITKL
jgi:hypothetical protein